MNTAYAIDFETYYDAECSVKTLGLSAYIRHPRFAVTHVAVYNHEYQYAGPPDAFDWSLLQGVTLVAHNAAFDRACWEHVAPPVGPKEWVCTAAMSRYLNGPGSLADCAEAWLGETIDKSVRDRMAGGQLDMFAQGEIEAYALTDARICWELYQLLKTGWPDHERDLWRITKDMGEHGVAIDVEYINDACATLGRIVEEHSAKLPWVRVGRPALSPDAFAQWCESIDVTPPASTARTDDRIEAWRDKNAGTAAIDWLDAMQTTRRANRTKRVLEAMLTRLKPDGRMAYELLYCGASTGRWSGAGGLNMQNFNRSAVAGIDIRSAIIAPPGKRLVVIDYSQIESRVLLWIAGDHAALDLLRAGQDIYEAHARQTMGYADERPLRVAAPDKRLLAKARVLGLGYGCGAGKFVTVAKIMGGLDLSFEESQRTVQAYRATNPLIVALWDRLGSELWACDQTEPDNPIPRRGIYRMPLPSGRMLRYYNVDAEDQTAESTKGQPEPFYGGKLTENLVSATARDVMADAWRALYDAGLHPIMSVHDEFVFECGEQYADHVLATASNIMRTCPAWAAGLPLDVDGQILTRYAK